MEYNALTIGLSDELLNELKELIFQYQKNLFFYSIVYCAGGKSVAKLPNIPPFNCRLGLSSESPPIELANKNPTEQFFASYHPL